MKKFLITGGYGLLGVSLVRLLLKKKNKVVILDYKKSNKSNFFFKKNKNLIIENGNFVNFKSLLKIFQKHNFDGIFHLGAQTQVLKAYQDPYHTHQTNVLGTLNLLEIIRIKKLKIPLIYSSSDKAYGELQKKYYYENDKLNASFPYDASKSASDIICQSYSKTYNIKVGIIRSANIFGECDFNIGRIVPETIISILKSKKLKIRSSGKQKRDYLYVEDVSIAYHKVFLELKNKKKKLLIYNTGSKHNLNALQLIKKIYKILGVQENYIIMNSSKAEIQNQRLNYNKIKREIGWEPKFSLDFGLKKTISWYKQNIKLFS
tara:strand:+ start:3168 stop:4124 length:957 start_codon:yes stop_codon:yes gene_type:complete